MATTTAPPTASSLTARLIVIAIISFLTLVDLFAAQAILPSLTAAYHVTPAQMSLAVNASTLGMAASGIAIGLLANRINRRTGVWLSLALLAIPTALLGTMPDLTSFTVLRIVQGVFMSASFSLTMAYLSEQYSARDIASALAAYVTGNVACNLFGRLLSASLASSFGLEVNFYVFAALNLIGAAIAYATLTRMSPAASGPVTSPFAAWAAHFRNPQLRSAFALGFIILFAFIGVFTYVNFILARPPISLSPMSIGFVYFVFIPAIITTPLAAPVARRLGTSRTFVLSFAVALLGLPLLLSDSIDLVLGGLILVACGTFFAQAAATGFVSRTATTERGAASGIYLASYYLGGLAGSAVLGNVFDRFGWTATIAVLAASLVTGLLLSTRLTERASSP